MKIRCGFGLGCGLLMILLLCPVAFGCVLLTDFEEGRYRDSTISGFYINCSNDTATDCLYAINDFANVSIENCSDPVINAELGWNRMSLCGSNGTAWNCTGVNFWAKKASDDSSFADYSVIIFLILMIVGLLCAASWLDTRLLAFVAGFGGVLLGYELLAFSMPAGLVVVVCSGLFCLGVMMK